MELQLDRRKLLVRTGLVLAAAGLGGGLWNELDADAEPDAASLLDWRSVRRQFVLAPDRVHLGSFLLASHPKPVRDAIARHRRRLDANPVDYLHGNWARFEAAVLGAAARYLRVSPTEIALTDSTTMGLALLYNGIDLRAGQEALTTRHDFFVTHEALRLKARQTGATVRFVSLYERSEAASEPEIVERIVAAVTPKTRLIALTWVHSSTGVKLPIRRIADALGPINGDRSAGERVLLCVDGVHGFGVENVSPRDLGADFFVAGCHKWLFGPRGTGFVWGRPSAWEAVSATIPSFTDTGTPGSEMTPGGFHSFEHRWALAEAFRFHQRIGKARIAGRIHALNTQFKDGLAAMPNVRLYTPRASRLSAGLVCFDVRGMSPGEVVRRLHERRIIATETPYQPSYARVGPGILNTPTEVRRALDAIRALR